MVLAKLCLTRTKLNKKIMKNIPRNPHEYERRILLVVIGMTPQIVTETLYKLAVQQQPAFVPTEVHLITTKEGAHSATLALLGLEKDQGWFQQFQVDYNFPEIQFDESNIHIITDTEGQFLDDNQSTEHNRVAADFITAQIKHFTADDNSALHVSLAGGRKTMSYYAGYALSLYGRGQDQLSHVLVSAIFQNNKDFFYPRPQAQRLEIDNRYYSTDDAKIILSDIPYVRMRYQIPQALLDGTVGFQDAVDKIQLFMQAETLVFIPDEKRVEFNTLPIKFTNQEYAFYFWLAIRKVNNKPPVIWNKRDYMNDFLAIYAQIAGAHNGHVESAENVKHENFEAQKTHFGPHISRIKKKIKAALGHKTAVAFLIEKVEYEDQEGYKIALPADAITII